MNSRPDPARHPDSSAWTEMLAGISEKSARLGDLVAKRWPSRAGTGLLAELERERSRIARELHAGAGQPLAGIMLHLEMLDESTSAMPEPVRTTITRLQTLTEQALGQVRAVSHRLHPPEWQQMNLKEAMDFLVDSSGLSGRLTVRREFPAVPEEPSHEVKVQIYRCAQECISNITRHSGATLAEISFVADHNDLVLTVSDNGNGFDTVSGKSGIGLRAIRENAAAMGGSARITSSPEGTRIVVRFPYSGDRTEE